VLVRVGQGAPLVVFVAHMDEIGFRVTAIRDDGMLEDTTLGGFFPSLYEAEPALVHTAQGPVPAVIAPRDSVGATPRRSPGRLLVDPGTGSRAGTEELGIRVGDTVTMPKRFVSLAGTRATGRSFDDRVGCAAQILALRRLDPRQLRHAVLFIFSTREETGLTGARRAAEALAGERPARVHALDTFVSADAPLEVKTFANAPLGLGAVARAVDNSSVTPPALLDSLVALARERRIPLQVGTTNGGNDGSVFTRFGVPDVPVGWPLRYSHSPAEVIDLKDLVAMADLTQAIAERW
jgi:putative aminopeptidase FrvX